MPYQSSKIGDCLDCGKRLSHPSAKRCRPCADRDRRGKPGHRKIQPNRFRVEGDTAYLFLTDRNGSAAGEAIVDAEDLPLVLTRRWSGDAGTGYATSTYEVGGKSQGFLLHRIVLRLEPGDGIVVDHKDRCPLNCRKSNLIQGDTPLNAGNRERPSSSRFPGVTWDKRQQRWTAQVRLNGRGYFLGRYEREEDAAEVYRLWRERHGLPSLVDPAGDHRNTDAAVKIVRTLRTETSKYIGVKRCRQTGRWAVSFEEHGRTVWLGRHDTEEQAAAVAAEWLKAHNRPTLRIVARLHDELASLPVEERQ